jgi:methyl acetate hydrolase
MQIRNLILFTSLLIVFFSCKQPGKEQGFFPSEETLKISLDSLLEKSDIPCLVVIAINKHGEKITYTYGNAIWDENIPVKENHIFRIASMTKLITSVAALQLVEKGLVGLDEDLSRLMPEMSDIPVLTDDKRLVEGSNPITLRHLLTHTSGFGYVFTDSLLAVHDRSEWSYEDLPRRFESGTKFLYGTSLDWAGRLVEKISGLNMEEYFRKNITGPLGMDRTWWNLPDSLKNEIVSYGWRGDDGLQELAVRPDRIPEGKQRCKGGGGMFSSPKDYTKLLACLLNDGIYPNGRILNKGTIDEMFKEQIDGISMDIKDNYYKINYCCDFRGLIKPESNWGLAGLIDTETTSYGRKEGTLLWGGVYNTYWYIDRESGIAASIYSQYLPFNYHATTYLFDKFSELVYQNVK